MAYEYIREQYGIEIEVNQFVQSRNTGRYGIVRPEGVKKDYVRVQFAGDGYHSNCPPSELDFYTTFRMAG